MTVIIPSKDARNLIPCMTAVRSHEPDAEILVIDDGLGADFLEHLRIVWRVKVLPGLKPFVFARNVNIGILMAGRDDVVLLNDDVILTAYGGLARMQRAQKWWTEYGLIGATTNHAGNANQWPRDTKGLLQTVREDPRMVCFMCVFIPRSTIDTVGLLDERFTAYGFEDLDYCRRVRNAGLKVGIHDGCFVDHGSLTSSFRGSANAGADLSGGSKIYFDKWGSFE